MRNSRHEAEGCDQCVDDLAKTLQEGAVALGLDLSGAQRDALMRFLGLLKKWNRAYNLTSLSDMAAMVSGHVLDSLSIHAYLSGQRILDVGSGAGLPGVPVAIANPDKRIVLLDSNAKKTRFLQQVATEIRLTTVQVVQVRVEDYHDKRGFDAVICRALGSLNEFVVGAGRLCKPSGRIIAMKGRYPQQELGDLPPGYKIAAVHKLAVPGLSAERHAVEIRKL